jgi:hypothetical protein
MFLFGYLYGFPREYDRDNQTETFVEWCVRVGVPESVAEEITYVMQWTVEGVSDGV